MEDAIRKYKGVHTSAYLNSTAIVYTIHKLRKVFLEEVLILWRNDFFTGSNFISKKIDDAMMNYFMQLLNMK